MPENAYQPVGYTNSQVVIHADVDARVSFIRSTYLHLLLAIAGFVVIEAVIFTLFHKQLDALVPSLLGGYGFLVLLVGFMGVSWIADYWARSGASKPMQYAGLSLYVLAEAIIFVPLLWLADARTAEMANAASGGIIQSAGIVTMVVFGGLTATVFLTKADFSFLRMAISIGSFAAFSLILVSFVFDIPGMGNIFSIAMVVLASGCILYTTSNILHHYRTDQSVSAALALFASVALMFWYILRLFMSRD